MGRWRRPRPHLSAFDRGFQLGDGVFETLRARAGRPTELDDHLERLRRSAAGLDIALAPSLEADVRGRDRGAARHRWPRRRGGRRVRAHHRQPRARDGPRAAPTGATQADDRDPGLAGGAAARGPPRAGPSPRGERRPPRPGESTGRPQDDQPRRLCLRAPRGAASRRRRCAVPHHRRPDLGGDERQRVPRPRRPSSRRPRSTARSCPARPGRGSCGGRSRPDSHRSKARSSRRDLAAADEAFLCSSVAGRPARHPVRGRTDRGGPPGPWTARAREAREAFIIDAVRRRRDAHDTGRAGPGHPPADRRGRPAGREPESSRAAGLAPAHGRPPRAGVGLDGSLSPRVAPGRSPDPRPCAAGR